MRILLNNTHIRDNIAFIMIAIAAYLTTPALVHAEVSEADVMVFTRPLPLSRGTLAPPGSEESLYLTHKGSCDYVVGELGWSKESCNQLENIITSYRPGIDSVLISKPNSEGFVKFDDWDKEDRDDEIKDLWDQMVEGSKEQSKTAGQTITLERWLIYPTLDKQKKTLIYAFLINWGGQPVVNIKASLFDRKGYVAFSIVPNDDTLTQEQMIDMVDNVLSGYTPTSGVNYADFSSGDKVAAVGAVGVLAGLLGVKYGKAAAMGLVAVVLAFVKKLWFLIVMPFLWLFKKFRKAS
jgi:uncharacterized membrane-anchored protein